MKFIEPSFEINKKGRVICKSHSNYDFFKDPNKDFFQEMHMDNLLTCKTCSHYQDNDCYFPKEEIDLIDYKRKKKRVYLCNFCGNKIDIMLTVIHKIYNEKKYNIQIPLICCKCSEDLNKNEFVRESYLTIIASMAITACAIFLFCFSIIWLSIFIPFAIILFPFSIILDLIAIKLIRKIPYTIKGLRYYKKHFSDKENKPKQGN